MVLQFGKVFVRVVINSDRDIFLLSRDHYMQIFYKTQILFYKSFVINSRSRY